MDNALTDLVGCRLPLQQAPMGGISGPALAAAVAEAGGIGTVMVFGMSPDQIVETVDRSCPSPDAVIAVNFITEQVDPDCLAAAASRARIVDFFWSEPQARRIEVVHAAGALVCWQVGSTDEARRAVDAGADLIAAQGTEAGGHVRGKTTLHELLPAVLEAVDVPVLAAGGIGDVTAAAAARDVGAAGIRVGTRFIATEESAAHPHYKQAVLDAGAGDTEITGAFAVGCPMCATQATHRVLRSAIRAAESLDAATVGTADFRGRTIDLPRFAGYPPLAGAEGHIEAMCLYASDAAGGAHAITPAGDVVRELVEPWVQAAG